MPPKPPRIRTIIQAIFIPPLFLPIIPLAILFPYFVYLGLFHTANLIPYVIRFYQFFFTNNGFRIYEGFAVALGVWAGITTFRKQRREWRTYQERISEGESATLVHLKNPVELSPPGELSMPQVVIESRRSLRTLFTQEVFLGWGMFFAYIMWSMYYFRWPPNEHLNYSILGTIGFIFIVGTIVIWRKRSERIIADGVGISIHKRSRERMIFWSD